MGRSTRQRCQLCFLQLTASTRCRLSALPCSRLLPIQKEGCPVLRATSRATIIKPTQLAPSPSPGGNAASPVSTQIQYSSLRVREHASSAHVTVVPAQALFEQVRSVLAERQPFRALQVIAQKRTIVRVRTILNDELRALSRRQASQVGEPLFGHYHGDVVFRVIHM